MSFISPEDWSKISGIDPSLQLVVGRGFVREELKALGFSQGLSFSGNSIVGMESWFKSLLPDEFQRWDEVGSAGRKTVLEQLFRHPKFRELFPLLSEKRRKHRFLEKLDQELERGRKYFVHFHESEAQHLRWFQKNGADPYLVEYWELAREVERVLYEKQILDYPLVLRILAEKGIRNLDCKFVLLNSGPFFPAESEIIQRLQNQGVLRVLTPPSYHLLPDTKVWVGHTIEDAAHTLVDRIEATENEVAIVIEDKQDLRRVLLRVFQERNLILRDLRNPMEILTDESIKTDLLELDCAASRFEYSRVLSWLKMHHPNLIPQVQKFGMRNRLDQVIPELSTISERWPDRLSLREFVNSIEKHLKSPAVHQLAKSWLSEVQLFGAENTKRPLAVWADQFADALKKMKPYTPGQKTNSRVGLYRVDQVPGLLLSQDCEVHFFGLSDNAVQVPSEYYDFYSERFCEQLSGDWEFPVRAIRQKHREGIFHSWCNRGNSVQSWQFQYDLHGKDYSEFSWVELGYKADVFNLGVHRAYEHSYVNTFETVSPNLQLKVLSLPKSFGFLEEYAKCPFKAYASGIAKWKNPEDLDWDEKRNWRGIVMHSAVQKMIQDGLDPESALTKSWHQNQDLRAGFKSKRLEDATKAEMLRILKTFAEEEKNYLQTSKVKPIHFEFPLDLDVEGQVFHGRADRIDEHSDGFVIVDYKTTASLPSAKDILEKGIGLQLGLYAWAYHHKTGGKIVGAQYVTLVKGDEKNRSKGVYFSEWNGTKVTNPLSKLTGRSHSLVQDLSAEQYWDQVWHKISDAVKCMKKGDFSANPADPKACNQCPYRICCGHARRDLQSE